MPLYDYSCDSCRKKFTAFVGMVSGSAEPVCPRCQGVRLTKLVSRFSSPRSDEAGLDRFAESADTDDPATLRKLMREMKDELGDEFGDDFDEMMDAAEAEEECETEEEFV